jgi:hypothetical protein
MTGNFPQSGRYEEEARRLAEGVLEGEGETDPALRRAVAARAGALSGRQGDPGVEMPEILKPYVDKVALHAYKVTDEDIEGLRKAGYSEDAIFEITLSAALGAVGSRP